MHINHSLAASVPVLAPATDGTLTARCARFIVDTCFEDLPVAALDIARRCMFDTSGLYIAGLHEASTRLLVSFAAEQGGAPQSRLLGAGGQRVPATAAARVLGTSAHAHDFDDTQVSHDPRHVYGLLTHPTVPPLTAALVVADAVAARGDAAVGWNALMRAFLIGFEVECKISEWLPAEHYLRGHHSSGTVGTFGAMAAAACLLQLDAAQVRNAIGIAASLAAGIRCNFGTMTKPLHVGRASENGVLAAQLAGRGFTADPDALDGRWGFPAVTAGGFDAAKTAEGFGATWSIVDPGVSIKPYPSGILTHQTMDAARALVIEHDIQPDQVAQIDLFAGDNIINPIRYPLAANGLQAKFSMPALLTMMVLFRDAPIRAFEDGTVATDTFQQMQRKVRVHRDAQINAQGFDRIRSRVRITLVDGRTLEREADLRYRGGPLLPMTDQEMSAKFRACTDGLIDTAAAQRLTCLLDGPEPPLADEMMAIFSAARQPG
ncbi:MmgE/PrpD family protein [Comamonadaceae bacterium G21597-S1]|nr:MmgE/PrpD family protein [Comamonadaceae bacterium G21597-S1]